MTTQHYEIKQHRRAGSLDEIPPMPGWGEIAAMARLAEPENKMAYLKCKRCGKYTPRQEVMRVGKSKSYFLCKSCFATRIVKTKEAHNAA